MSAVFPSISAEGAPDKSRLDLSDRWTADVANGDDVERRRENGVDE